jgi:hypothetical protein
MVVLAQRRKAGLVMTAASIAQALAAELHAAQALFELAPEEDAREYLRELLQTALRALNAPAEERP